jgi:nucleotide-binding universal stress UspA family protein
MSLHGGLLTAALIMCLSPALAAESLTVLTVDAEYLESTMPLYASIANDARNAQVGADAVRRSDIELAHELRRSEVLSALPEAIAEIARAAQADLVIDRATARRIGEASARDITREVERILVAQFGQLPLEPGS